MTVRVLVLPLLQDSPYQRLLRAELEEAGAHFVEVPSPKLARAVRGGRDIVDVVHLHWLEYLTGSNEPGRLAAARIAARAVVLVTAIAALRLRGVRVVWTVHNLRPHDARHPRIDLVTATLVSRLANRLIVHSRYAARLVQETYGRGDAAVAYHGHFQDVYEPPRRDRAEMRQALGIPQDAFVFLAFGLARAYKRIPELIQAFRALPAQDVRLLVVGRAIPPELGNEIVSAAGDDPRVILRAEHLPDDEVTELHAAADAAVIAYRDVFSSGVLLLSLGCGLPVVAPADSTATEIADWPAVQPYEPGELSAALARSIETGSQREAALAAAARYPWSRMLAAHEESYG